MQDLDRLVTTLVNSKIQKDNNALFQTINGLIVAARDAQTVLSRFSSNDSISLLGQILTYGTAAERATFQPLILPGVLILFYETDTQALYVFTPTNGWELAAGGITELTGDVLAGPGSGSQVATIPNQTIDYAKIQNVTDQRLLGRYSGSPGSIEEIVIGSNLNLTTTGILSATGASATVGNLLDVIFAYKTTDQTVTSSTVVVNDTALVFPVQAGEIWQAEFCVFTWSTSNTPKWKYRLSTPTGSTAKVAQDNVLFSVNANSGDIDRFSANTTLEPRDYVASLSTATIGDQLVRIPALVLVGATAGNVQLQWAQNTSSTLGTTVRALSYVVARRFQ